MTHHPMWRPDSTKPVASDVVPSATAPPEAAPSTAGPSKADNLEAARREFDFAELAAKFAAPGGGNMPADVSGELALDIVLNEIVEQACLATGATGAAIALAHGEEMICRASTGGSAPELGTRLNMNSGLAGACARTRQIQCFDDALSDPSGDSETSRQLGVRSVVVLPLLRDEELIGIFEIFSSRPHAFGDRDLRTLEILAERILKNVQSRQSSSVACGLGRTNLIVGTSQPDAAENIEEPLKTEMASASAAGYSPSFLLPAQNHRDATEARPAQGFDWLTGVMGAILLCVAILMGAGFGMRLGWLKARGHPSASRAATALSSATLTAAPNKETNVSPAVEAAPAGKKSANAQAESRAENARVPEGGLRVYENGKEIFRVPPAEVDATASSTENGGTAERPLQPAGLIELSADAAEGILVHRVEPEYPEQARMQHVQGPVLLDVHMDREGAVQDVKLVGGDPLLGEAAIAAVRQWRFKPQMVNGRAVEMETKITLRFTLPPS